MDGSIRVMAWGSSTIRRVWNGVSPMDRPASRWPLGSAPTPERISSAMTLEL